MYLLSLCVLAMQIKKKEIKWEAWNTLLWVQRREATSIWMEYLNQRNKYSENLPWNKGSYPWFTNVLKYDFHYLIALQCTLCWLILRLETEENGIWNSWEILGGNIHVYVLCIPWFSFLSSSASSRASHRKFAYAAITQLYSNTSIISTTKKTKPYTPKQQKKAVTNMERTIIEEKESYHWTRKSNQNQAENPQQIK